MGITNCSFARIGVHCGLEAIEHRLKHAGHLHIFSICLCIRLCIYIYNIHIIGAGGSPVTHQPLASLLDAAPGGS